MQDTDSRRLAEPVDQLFPDTPAAVRVIVASLRALVCATLPAEATEIFAHGALGYGPTASSFDRILYIAPQRGYANLGFFYGAQLHNPTGLLEGSGKQMRHIKIRQSEAAASAERAEIVRLLREAWDDGLACVAARHRPKR